MARRTRKATNGAGSVKYDRARRSWVARFTVGTDANGRQVRRSARRPTQAEAQAWLDDELQHVEGQRRRGIAPAKVPKANTVAEWLNLWLTDLLPGTVAPSTYAGYESLVRVQIIPALGAVRLTDLAPADVTRMVRQLAAAGYSSNTQRLARAVLRRALHRAEIEGLVLRNVAALSDGVRLEQPEGRTLTPLEARRLLTFAADDRLEAAYLVALTTGLRRGELLALHWSDVDLDAARLTVRGSQRRETGGGLVVDATKTRTSRRTLRLAAPVVAALRRHAERQAAERRVAADEWVDTGRVFTTPFGTPIDGRNFARYLSLLTQRAGLGHWTPHELRHSAASILLAQGVPLKVVSDVLGHTSIRVTADVYGHLLEPAKAEAAAAMSDALFGP